MVSNAAYVELGEGNEMSQLRNAAPSIEAKTDDVYGETVEQRLNISSNDYRTFSLIPPVKKSCWKRFKSVITHP